MLYNERYSKWMKQTSGSHFIQLREAKRRNAHVSKPGTLLSLVRKKLSAQMANLKFCSRVDNQEQASFINRKTDSITAAPLLKMMNSSCTVILAWFQSFQTADSFTLSIYLYIYIYIYVCMYMFHSLLCFDSSQAPQRSLGTADIGAML